jgi:putative oxidoreductase
MPQLLERPPEPVTVDDEHTAEKLQQRRRVRPINVNNSLLLLRVVVGLLFIGHGCQKLFGLFGGDGLAAWTASVEKAGIQPAATWATVAAGAELVGGVLLVLGLLTPLASAALIGDMLVAILKVHAPKGLWSQQGGFEYNLVLVALLLAIGLMGPGLYSLDRHLPFTVRRPYVFLGALVLTLIGVGLAVVPTLVAR